MIGSFLFALSLYLDDNADWTSWISFVICGFLQTILILIPPFFELFPVNAQQDLMIFEN
jgi:hypothetical protein